MRLPRLSASTSRPRCSHSRIKSSSSRHFAFGSFASFSRLANYFRSSPETDIITQSMSAVKIAGTGRLYFRVSAMPETIKARLTSLWNCASLIFWKTCKPSHAPATPGSAYAIMFALMTLRPAARLNPPSVRI